MPTATHVSLAEYLNTEYEPDCEYLDGVLEERNVGWSATQTQRTTAVLDGELRARYLNLEISPEGILPEL
jgi:hypothetical protein